MKKSRTLLAFLALALAVATVLPGTWAYFTANTSAGGGRTMHFQNETEITEGFNEGEWKKEITITASSGTQPVYVRARAYSTYDLTYAGNGWKVQDGKPASDDGWCYYETPLANFDGAPTWTKTQAELLTVQINIKDLEPGVVPEDFDVVVVYETTPVTYDENGNPQADWNQTLIVQNGGAK